MSGSYAAVGSDRPSPQLATGVCRSSWEVGKLGARAHFGGVALLHEVVAVHVIRHRDLALADGAQQRRLAAAVQTQQAVAPAASTRPRSAAAPAAAPYLLHSSALCSAPRIKRKSRTGRS